MKKKIAIIISVSLIVATTVTLLSVYIPQLRNRTTGFNWVFPSNSTSHTDYMEVPYEVPMRDGITLSATVFLPSDINESLPVILVRTPYGKGMLSMLAGYTYEDYIVVLQDFRGFFGSQGEKGLPFITEQNDGQDTLNWISDQPWCNGKIGTWGPSALGIAQYLLAPNAPSTLKCQLPIVATADIYESIFRGGELRNELIIPWITDNDYPEESLDLIQENEKLNGIWEVGRLVDNYSDIHVPALHMGGWYDIFTQNTIDAFLGYQNEGGEGANGNSKLIMGPWIHGGIFGEATGSIIFPNQNIGILTKANNALFGKWLKENSTLWDMLPTVSFYVMSSIDYNPLHLANQWYQSSHWPLVVSPTEFYFFQNGSLLTSQNTEVSGALHYQYDPNDPVITLGGGNLALDAGIYDQSSLESRADVLVFSTPILTEPLTVAGQISVKLYISSNCTDTDFTVKITDVYPDNRSMLITDTIIRARNRDSLSDWNFLTPGEVYELNIPLDSTAYLFNKDHRLRVDISSSNYPRFETNPNTGDGLWANETVYVANNTLFMNSVNKAKITLPSVDITSLTPFSFYDLTALSNRVKLKNPIVDLSRTDICTSEFLTIIMSRFRRGRILFINQLTCL